MIVKTFDLYGFKREFENYYRGNVFSDEALEELFNYYDDFGEPYELDVIDICCNWTEYESLDDYANDYMDENDLEGLDDDERDDAIWNYLDSRTYFVRLGNGNILIINH